MIEIERKYRLTPAQANAVKKKVQAKGTLYPPIHQVDTIYLKGVRSFMEFTQGMPVVRIRTEDSVSKLTYKRSINKAGDSVEHELSIGNPTEMDQILRAEGYQIVTRVVKDRSEVKSGEYTYALDDVKGLGVFLEIEIIGEDDSQVESASATINTIAATLGLDDSMIETKKYDRLMSDKERLGSG